MPGKKEEPKLHDMAAGHAGLKMINGANRAAWLARVAATLVAGASLAAIAEESPAKSDATQSSAIAKPDAEAGGTFKPPPGFRTRKRGSLVVYCRKEAVLGSRFPAEKCYDEAGLRELKRAELERTEMLERMRACTTGSCSTG